MDENWILKLANGELGLIHPTRQKGWFLNNDKFRDDHGNIDLDLINPFNAYIINQYREGMHDLLGIGPSYTCVEDAIIDLKEKHDG